MDCRILPFTVAIGAFVAGVHRSGVPAMNATEAEGNAGHLLELEVASERGLHRPKGIIRGFGLRLRHFVDVPAGCAP